MEKRNDIKFWNEFWNKHKEISLDEGPDTWYMLVWKVGLEYWSDIFNRLSPGKKMLECGAGSAKVSLYMAKQGYSCVMLDNSDDGLNPGKINFKKANINGEFVLGDVEKLPFEEGTFDIVYSGGLLHHFHDIHPAVKEMIRVLKPDGLFAATVITKKFSCQTLGDIQIFWAKFARHLVKGEIKGIVKRSRRNFPFYENSISLKEYKKIAEESGLKNVVATGNSPFPAIALPQFLHPVYAKFMKMFMPCWKWFNNSDSKFTEIWGATFSIYGIKKKT